MKNIFYINKDDIDVVEFKFAVTSAFKLGQMNPYKNFEEICEFSMISGSPLLKSIGDKKNLEMTEQVLSDFYGED